MLGFFPSRRNDSAQELLVSELFNENTFYPALLRDLRRCQSELIIESPFITTKRLTYLLPSLQRLTRQGIRVVVNTKPPEEDDGYLRDEAGNGIALLQSIGVQVLPTSEHHWKLTILDKKVLYKASINAQAVQTGGFKLYPSCPK